MIKYPILILLTFAMIIAICGSAAAVDQTVIPSYADSNLTVANDAGARFDAMGNESYNFFNSSAQSATQGQNALHITPSNSSNSGNVTFTNAQSGTFYMSDTGGRGWDDNGILMIAINGTIPDNFWIHITASGYQWTPLIETDHPTPDNMTYVPVTLNETFTKYDFLYGPQIWKPCPANNYSIFEGQDMSNTTNTFSIMFVDLWAGLFGQNTRSLYPGVTFVDNGMIKITYELFNLPDGALCSFTGYAYCQHSKQGEGVRWVTRTGSTGASGYNVVGITNLPVADFSANPTSGTVPLTVQFTDNSTGTKPLNYSWDFNNDNVVDSTEQNPTYVYNTPGTYTVKLTVTNTAGNSTKMLNITTSSLDIVAPTPSANLTSGSYNTNQTVNLTAIDDQDPNPKIYYTLNGADPTGSSTLYASPINISNEGVTVLKFITVDASNNWSPVYTKTYTVDKTAPSASANPAGGTYNIRQNVTLSATDNLDANPFIYYTVNGSDPITNGTIYTGSITVSNTTTIKFAVKDAAGNWGPVYNETYAMVDIAAPVASVDLPNGSYTSDQVARLSAVDELDIHPKIYYTTDGNNPTTNSTLYDWPIGINLVGTTILKVIAVDAAGHISDIITRIYMLDKPGASGTWNSTTLDSNIMYNSVAVDASGNPHIAYYQKAGSASDYPDLKYAYHDATGWHIETLETTQSGSGYYVSLALDSLGYPHIAYSQSSPDKLKYAYKDATGWHFIVLVNNSDVSYINLAMYQDKPQISYYENTEEKIKYIYYNGTNWINEYVTSNPVYGHWNSLALNSIGNPRISFYYFDIYTLSGVLEYAKRTPTGIWQITTVDNSSDVGTWNSLAIDSSGNPRISYIDTNGGVKYAYWANAQWNIETVGSLASSACKLVLDQSDNPRIVYQDYITANLKYAYKEGSNWIITNIDTLDGTGLWSSLTLNPSGSPSVSYMSANSRLKYANLVPFIANADPIGGTYNLNQTVNLTSTPGTSIYYILDANNDSDPRTNGTKYTGPIVINHSTVLKFAAVDSANNWGSIHTETYVIIIPVTNARTNKTYTTIQSAIDDQSTTDGDTLTVNAGNYIENVIVNKCLILNALKAIIIPSNMGQPVFTITSGGNGSTISGFIITGSTNSGIYIDNSVNNTIINNMVFGNGTTAWGICIINSNGNSISGNNITNCTEGINLYNATGTIISGNNVTDSIYDGVALNLSTGNTITGNNGVTRNVSGIRLIGDSNNNIISNNNLTGNIWTSISLVSSKFNQITGNTLSNNQEGMYLYASNNNTLSNNTANNNIWDGIAIHDSYNNTITGHTNITVNNCGIRIIGTSAGNKVYNNAVNSNLWSNISIDTATNNQIYNNTLNSAKVGLYLQGASNNIIYNNTIQNNAWDGIDVLFGSNNNSIHNNAISGSYYGERIISSTNNTSYMNNFINNTVQSYDDGTNNWDNGSTGNYWSDWSTTNPRSIAGGSSVDQHPNLASF